MVSLWSHTKLQQALFNLKGPGQRSATEALIESVMTKLHVLYDALQVPSLQLGMLHKFCTDKLQ